MITHGFWINNMNRLPSLTPQERQEAIEKSKLAKQAKKMYAEQNLKLSFSDEQYWRNIASELDIKLPQRYDHGPKAVKKLAKKLGINIQEWVESTGFTTLSALCKANKTFPSFAIAGIMLEYYLENQK